MKPANHWNVSRDQALPRLLDEYGGTLLALGKRFCHDPHQAEDLVQEVFLSAWRGWDEFEGRSDPATWLYTIAARACQRLRRKRAGEPEHFELAEDDTAFRSPSLGVVPDGLTEQIRREAIERVGAAIVELPDEFRMPLVLKDVAGFSVQAVAAILGISPGTVKSRVHRARLRLRDALDSALPRRHVPPAAYDERVCMDLLEAKQDALDRGVEMPPADPLVCERCEVVFSTLDLAHDTCRVLGEEPLPAELRSKLLESLRARA